MRMQSLSSSMKPTESGQAGAEILFFACVVFTALTLIIVNTWATVDAKFMVTAAAREATRAYVESEGPSSARSDAQAASARVVASYSAHVDRAQAIEITGRFARCQRVTIRASYKLPALQIPLFGVSIGSRVVSSTHSEIVDPYRSGLADGVGGECLAA
jgi:hypothetical protein